MYTDDTTLFCCLEDIDSINKELVLNSELKSVHLWLSANKLTLNLKSRNNMLFSKHKNTHLPKLNFQINNSNIQSTSEFNFLGLHNYKHEIKLGYTCKCNWQQNITCDWIIKKYQIIFLKESLLSIYNALIFPYINYCLLSWGSGSAVKNIFFKSEKGNSCHILCWLQCTY